VTISAPDLASLQGALAGSVLVPGSPGYDSARKPALARFHHIRPQAIVRCENADDVAETLAFARRRGVRAAPRSGGHCFAGRSSTEGIVLDVTPMHAVSVSDGRATIGAGARLGDLYDALQQHDVTIPAGCGPTVGIAGLTLGGGLGILGRKYGLTCDQLVAARVVLADGRVVDCDQHHDGELFWALRGAGGGHFGVVTSLVFTVLPAPAATRFHLTWPHAHAAAVIAAWQAWAPDAPDELNANLMLTAAGGSDRPPTVHVFGAMLADQAETVALLDQLVARSAAEPASASHTRLPYRDLKRSLVGLGGADGDGEPDRPGHVFSKSEFFRRPLPHEAITALLRNLPRGWGAGQSRALNFTPLGGAYNRVPADATAYVHRDERFLVEHVAVVDPEAATATRGTARQWVARSRACVHPWGSGRVYPNFPDPDLADWTEAYYGTNYERLVRVKRTYDPQNLFRFEQSLRSASTAPR
jgi:FAD/FMN-containing dehydrogenase